MTVLEYPIILDNNTYMVKKFCSGQIIFSWPLQPPAAGASAESATVAMPVLRIKNRKAQTPS
jgi:hypothetical protein